MIQKTQNILNGLRMEEFATTIKEKWVQRMENCVAARGRYFEKDPVRNMASDSESDDL